MNFNVGINNHRFALISGTIAHYTTNTPRLVRRVWFHPHIALFVVVDDSLNRRFQCKPFAGSDGVAVDQPIGQFWLNKARSLNSRLLAAVDELLLDGAVERSHTAFILFVSSLIRIRFADYAPFRSRRNGGRFGIGSPVGDAVQVKALLEASPELRAVIFDPEARWFWQPLTQRVKGDGSLLAGLGGFDVDSEAGVRVDEGEQAAAQSIAQAHHGIAGEHFKRLMFEAFGFAGDEFVAAAGTQSGGGVAHFVWVAGR